MKFSKEEQLKKLKRPKLKALDSLLSRAVRLMAYDKKLGFSPCWICGKEGTQAAHIFSKKAYPKSRFDVDQNVKWTCYTCHKGGKHSMHEDPETFRMWYEHEFGISAWDNLQRRVHLAEATSSKLDTLMIKMWLQEEIKRLEHIQLRDSFPLL